MFNFFKKYLLIFVSVVFVFNLSAMNEKKLFSFMSKNRGKYSEKSQKYKYLIAQREQRAQLRKDRRNLRKKTDDFSRRLNILSDDSQKSSELTSVKQKIKSFQDKLEAADQGDRNEIEGKLSDYEDYMNGLEKEDGGRYKSYLEEEIRAANKEAKYMDIELEGKNLGDIILRGVAGKNWEMVEDLRVGDNILEGLGKGIMVKTSVSVGDSIGSIIDGYVHKLFNTTLGKFESFFSVIYRFIFHSSCIPFIEREVSGWRKMIRADFMALESMVKDAGKFSAHGRDDILREYEKDQEEKTDVLNLWRDFVEDQAITYDELASEMALRSGYYKQYGEGFGIINCAKRLENKLLKVSKWLIGVQSLKDFANIPEMKSILPAMRKSLDNYFQNLIDQVKPLNEQKRSIGSNFSDKSSDWGNSGFGGGNSFSGGMDTP